MKVFLPKTALLKILSANNYFIKYICIIEQYILDIRAIYFRYTFIRFPLSEKYCRVEEQLPTERVPEAYIPYLRARRCLNT